MKNAPSLFNLIVPVNQTKTPQGDKQKRRDGMAESSEWKVIANGHVIEVYKFEKAVSFDYAGKGGRSEVESDRAEENRRLTCRRARDMIRRICIANFDEHSKFLTLTYKRNETNVKAANIDFKKFIQKMRYRFGQFKYVAVIEFQDRGAVHYHVMTDLPYIPNAQLNAIWDHGFVKINDITHVDNVGAYMVKYMLKDVTDKRLAGQKAYLTSRGIDRPVSLRGDQAKAIIEAYGLEDRKKAFESSYTSEHHGKIDYSEYNLKRDE
jgi:hypothetical protein